MLVFEDETTITQKPCIRRSMGLEGYSGEGVNKILMLCSLSSHSCVALPNIYGLYVELVLIVSCLRLLLLTPEGACISLMLKSSNITRFYQRLAKKKEIQKQLLR